MFPIGPVLRSRKFLIPSGLLALAGAASAGLMLWAGDHLASPPRRSLMDHHREFLADPAAHGMRIERFTASDGTPCLVCTPQGVPGMRGALIRDQLEARNLTVPSFGAITGNLMLLHGRKGRKEDFLPIAERLCAAGFRCIIPDLPAHGEHPGKVITYGVREAALPAQVFREASRHFGFQEQPCGLIGMSMGGSVAVHAAALPDAPWKALVIIASFDALEPAVRGQATVRVGDTLASPWMEGAAKIYESKTGLPLASVQPGVHAARIGIPTLVAHGTNDTITLLSSGRKLFDAFPASTEKQWIEVPGAGHDNVLITEFPIYATIAEWMINHLR
ncbi:MAG: alpha/beta hydrolase [Verrucomicrobiaceae bacterium]|nr:MAG: alpha/beta hydrolase [Verrucomicrobiaceae bacterium]